MITYIDEDDKNEGIVITTKLHEYTLKIELECETYEAMKLRKSYVDDSGKNFILIYESSHGCIDYAVTQMMDFVFNHHIVFFAIGSLIGLYLIF